MQELDGELRVQFVNLDTTTGETQVLTLSSYEDDTVLFIGEAHNEPKIFNLNREQLQELYIAAGKALEVRETVLEDTQVHFSGQEVREYMER